MIDAHAHVHDEAFDTDRDAVVARAVAAGVARIITIGTDPATSQAAVACAKRYPEVFAVVGIHPNELPVGQGVDWDELKAIARSSQKVVGIGECGLDYYTREPQPAITDRQKKVQKDGFSAQIGLAEELGLPIIVHCRPSLGSMDAYEDLFGIFQSAIKNLQSKIILHCYQGDTAVTEKFLALPNVWFSFAGNVTYPVKKVHAGTKDDIRGVVRMVPLERVLVETDCPYLAPQAHRGERNEPAYVVLSAATVAGFSGVDEDTLAVVEEKNARLVFGV